MDKRVKEHLAMDQWLTSHRMIPEDLNKLVEVIINEFLACKRIAYPGYSINARRHGVRTWQKVAMRIKDHNYDPIVYVRAVMSAYGAQAYANMLLTRDHAHIYNKYMQVTPGEQYDSIVQDLSRQTDYVKLRTSQGQSLADILKDPINSFDSLFIWCMATANGLPDIASRYTDRAKVYLHRPVYVQVYSKYFNVVDFGGMCE